MIIVDTVLALRELFASQTSSAIRGECPQALLDSDERTPTSELRHLLEGPCEGEHVCVAAAPPDDL